MRFVRLAAGIGLIGVLISVLVFSGGCEGLRQQTVRLHVLAHSDSDEDQALKLQVRDAVTAAAATVLDGCDGHDAALSRLQTALPDLQATAQQCVYDAGYTYPVTAELTEMYFTTRTYDSGTFPAGMYDALRIRIGDAKGRNWWCVVYPPLCVSAAMQPTDEGLSPAASAVIHTPQYAVRFKIVEWWEKITAKSRQ